MVGEVDVDLGKGFGISTVDWLAFFGNVMPDASFFHSSIGCLDGGFKHFYFHPYLGKTPILTNIFQVGWNRQLVLVSTVRIIGPSFGGFCICFFQVSGISSFTSFEIPWFWKGMEIDLRSVIFNSENFNCSEIVFCWIRMTPLWTIRDIFYLLPRRKVFHPQSLTWNPKKWWFQKKNSFRWVGYVQVSHEKWAPGCSFLV